MSGTRSPGRQPGLDADNISLYRDHRCLVTLTVHTNKINPAMKPTTTSANSMTNSAPVVVIQRDGQHGEIEREIPEG